MIETYALMRALATPANGFPWFRPQTPFVVIRGTGTDRDGVWYDNRDVPRFSLIDVDTAAASTLTLHASGQYEQREDGALAERYTPAPPFAAPRPRSLLGRVDPWRAALRKVESR